ncbi:MAG: hypothetical protein ACREIV_00515, partial [Planctomycetaceae bacterium]
LYPFQRLENGKYDLEQWNDEYWDRFETFLRETHARDIIVQIEVWDRFDYARENWPPHPYNPQNNVNYTSEESGLAAVYTKHPGRNEQPFFFTVPELRDNETLLKYQQAQVDKMLSYSLKYPHVLYCIDNETSGAEEWGAYWAEHIRRRARETGVEVHVTEMWDRWDVRGGHHSRTYDHPKRYSFIDVSQNNHNSGQEHWENLMWVRARVAENPRPINTVKIYGADGGRYGTTRDGVERFWRNLFGGAAGTRFHRPDSGIGLNDTARTHIRSLQLLKKELDFWNCTPDAESKQLSERDANEAYLTFRTGEQYAVYFPDGGAVSLDLTDAKGTFQVKWLDLERSRWTGTAENVSTGEIDLQAPSDGHWVALVSRVK